MMNKTKIKRYMKHYPDLLLLFTLLSVTTMIKAQISIRPYSEWEATQFVAVNGHQPEDYVTPDNNWEILYNLRTHVLKPNFVKWVLNALIANYCYWK